MTQHETTAVRAFIDGGSIAHLVKQPGPKALCKADPWPGTWSFRPDEARELPLCFDCLHIVSRPARKKRR